MAVSPEVEAILINLLIATLYMLVALLLGRFIPKKIKEIFLMIINARSIKSHLKEEKFLAKIIDLLAVFVKYVIYFIGIVLALIQLNIYIVSQVIYDVIEYTPNVLISGVFLVVGIMLANLSKRIVKIGISSTEIDEMFSDLEPKFLPSNFFGIMVQYIILIIAITVSLSQLGLQTQLLSWIAFSITTIITVFMFLFAYSSLKPYLPDVVAGVMIRNRRYFRTGEYIDIEGKKYRVMGIGLIHTRVERNKKLKIINNSEIIKKFERKV